MADGCVFLVRFLVKGAAGCLARSSTLLSRRGRPASASRLGTRPIGAASGATAALGYRKGTRGGVWLVRVGDPDAGGGYRQGSLATADDTLKADGTTVLDFRQAESRARAWVARHHRVKAGLEPEASVEASKPYTVAEAMTDYLGDYEARGGKGVAQTRTSVVAHILPPLGDVVVSRLTRERVKGWHRSLATTPARLRAKAGAPVRHRVWPPNDLDMPRRRRSTANRVLTTLKAALNHARAEGKATCAADAWANVKAFRETEQPKVRYLLDAEATRLVNACPSGFRDLVSAALLTGARYGELARMTASDFDLQAGTVTIAASKGGKPRHVFLTDEGRTLFDRLAAGRPGTSLLFARMRVVKQATRSAPAETRRVPWGASDQSRVMREACAAARITPAIGFHVLRHTYASRLATRGVPMPVIAAQLGHSDTRMTERHYAHLSPTYVAETVRAAFGTLGLGAPENVVVPLRRA